MAVKGSISKEKFTQKILETFEGAFIGTDGKEIRIPYIEDGNEIQLKITATCAKENVPHGEGGDAAPVVSSTPAAADIKPPSDEEISQVRNIMKQLGL